MSRSRLALAVVLVGTLAFGQNADDCPAVYPPDACETEAAVGSTPAAPPLPPPGPASCPCSYVGNTVNSYIAAKCTGMGYTPAPTCTLPPANPAFAFIQCDPGGANPPWNLIVAVSNDGAATCDFDFKNCDGGFPCVPVTDWDSGSLGGLTAAEQDLCDAELVPPSGPCA